MGDIDRCNGNAASTRGVGLSWVYADEQRKQAGKQLETSTRQTLNKCAGASYQQNKYKHETKQSTKKTKRAERVNIQQMHTKVLQSTTTKKVEVWVRGMGTRR